MSEPLIRPDEAHVVKLFDVFGIPIKVHIYLPAVAVMSALSAAFGGWLLMLFALVLYGPILFGTVLVHELGHALETKHLGGSVDSIIMWPLGGLALCGGTTDPWQDLKVAVAGPFTHLPMLLFWWLLLVISTGGKRVSFSERGLNLEDDFWVLLCIQTCWLNIGLLIFNLCLPAYPLDGGRVMAAALTIRGMEPNRAALITSRTAIFLATGLLCFGVWGFVTGNVHSMVTVLIALWILHASKQLHDAGTAGRAGDHPLFSRSGTYATASSSTNHSKSTGNSGGKSNARRLINGNLV